MTQTAIRLTATVLPGKRVEFTAPELTEGENVEIFVALPQTTSLPAAPDSEYVSALDLIDSFPSGPRSAGSWEEIERNFREERDSWER